MAQLKIGELAPDFTLPSLTGENISLRDYRGQPVLLLFLRHLGCLPCREHVAELLQHGDELEQLDVQVLTISFSAGHWAGGWTQETGSPYPLLLDPERQSYKAYQLRSSRLRSWGPNVLWRYAKLLRAGEKLRPAQGDPHQLGGDFIIDAEGIIRLAHPSADPVDRPAVDTLLTTLAALRGKNQPRVGA